MENQNVLAINKTINKIFIHDIQSKAIECPVASYGATEAGDIRYCFGSFQDAETLVGIISNSLGPITTTRMGWRQDVGIWITTYQFIKSKYRLSVTMKEPATRDLMKDDPIVNKYKTIIACYITK